MRMFSALCNFFAAIALFIVRNDFIYGLKAQHALESIQAVAPLLFLIANLERVRGV